MITDICENDEPIHHFEGKDFYSPCQESYLSSAYREVNYTSFPLIYESPPIDISPHRMKQCRLLELFEKFLSKCKFRENKPIIVNQCVNIQGLTFVTYNNLIAMKNLAYNLNIYIRGNNYGFNNFESDKQHENDKTEAEESDDADPAEVVEVSAEPVRDTVDTVFADYSNSKLVPKLTYPQQANYLIGWMHQNIDIQSKFREKVKVLLALDSRGFFKSKVDFEDFIDEFKVKISKSWYSRLINSAYPTTDYENILESLDMGIFPLEK